MKLMQYLNLTKEKESLYMIQYFQANTRAQGIVGRMGGGGCSMTIWLQGTISDWRASYFIPHMKPVHRRILIYYQKVQGNFPNLFLSIL